RAFVVPRAEPLPGRAAVLGALTKTDFRQTVLLEDYEAGKEAPLRRGEHTARIRSYQPNRVELEVKGDAPGYLVLADPWYPGWTCTVDGAPARVYRANYLFRAVAVGPGTHEVVFRFEPASYRLGKRVTLGTLALVTALGLGGCCARLGRRWARPS